MPKLGFVGLGIMGRPMARNLLKAGYDLVVCSRSRGPIDELVAHGAVEGESLAVLAERCEVIITMLPDTPDLLDVAGGALLDHMVPGGLLIDMSTVSPLVTRELAAAFAARGASMVDAPVSGGERGATDGTLSIMVGGASEDVVRCQPIFEILGSRTTHVGGPGAGQVAKACNQLVVGLTIEAVAEALVLARTAGVDPRLVREALLGGFASSRVLEVHGGRMLEERYDPGFRIRLHSKDAGIVRQTGDALGLGLPGVRLLDEVLKRAEMLGLGERDHAALAVAATDAPTAP